eukprot:4686299-Pyramimonas_sp.AAC.1
MGAGSAHGPCGPDATWEMGALMRDLYACSFRADVGEDDPVDFRRSCAKDGGEGQVRSESIPGPLL